MVSTAGSDADSSPAAQLTNKVLKVLSLRGSGYKAFGENVILLLNRESKSFLFQGDLLQAPASHFQKTLLLLLVEMLSNSIACLPLPSRRNLSPAPHPQNPLPPLHHPFHPGVLLHKRSPRPRRYHDPQPPRPTPQRYRPPTYLLTSPSPITGTHPTKRRRKSLQERAVAKTPPKCRRQLAFWGGGRNDCTVGGEMLAGGLVEGRGARSRS